MPKFTGTHSNNPARKTVALASGNVRTLLTLDFLAVQELQYLSAWFLHASHLTHRAGRLDAPAQSLAAVGIVRRALTHYREFLDSLDTDAARITEFERSAEILGRSAPSRDEQTRISNEVYQLVRNAEQLRVGGTSIDQFPKLREILAGETDEQAEARRLAFDAKYLAGLSPRLLALELAEREELRQKRAAGPQA